jgi:phosphoglycerol transferase MdoB-like AlkP superfamily enzyme
MLEFLLSDFRDLFGDYEGDFLFVFDLLRVFPLAVFTYRIDSTDFMTS